MDSVGTTYSNGIKAKTYLELLKPRLSFLVAFSSGFGFLLGNSAGFEIVGLSLVMIGGFMVSGSAVIINQIIERDLDKIMTRTSSRPIPTGKVSVEEGILLACITGLIGLSLLWIIANLVTVFLSLISLVLYAFVYTPLKRVGPVAVFVGAIPGALPPFIGWVAATGTMGYEPGILFGIQFIWQFPHFWAIAWVSDEDYKKVGFKLLPGGGRKDIRTAFNIMIYTLLLLPLGLLPMIFKMTGTVSAVVATLCGVLFLIQSFSLIRTQLVKAGDENLEKSRKSALKVMFGSFIYLPIVQIAFLVDKI